MALPAFSLQLCGPAAAVPGWLQPAWTALQAQAGAPGDPPATPGSIIVLHLAPPAVTPEAGATHWLLLDGEGRALCPDWPLLQAIAQGRGVALQCWQHDPARGWRRRRRLHLAAASAYASGRAVLPQAAHSLLCQALVDLRGQVPLSSSPLPAPRAAPRLSAAGRLAWRLQGSWRRVAQRQRERWLTESWRVGVIDQPIGSLLSPGALPPVRWLTAASRDGYWADPQGLPGSDSTLLCEFFDARVGLGRIEQLELQAAGAPRRRAVAVGDGRHASFPQVFELDGRRLGLAETMSQRSCWLHAVDADGHWQALWPLLQDTAAADPTLFRWAGRYWLAYTDADQDPQDNLCLCHADRLEGPWLPHANNPVKRDIRGARMAGRFFEHEGALYRPGQDCLEGYGAAVVLHRVEQLSPSTFEEVAVRRLQPEPGSAQPDGLHTVNGWGGHTLVDGKRLALAPLALLRKLARRLLSPGPPPARPGPVAGGGPTGDCGLFVYVPHLRTGGGEVSMLQLAAGFAAAGREVTLVVHTARTQELAVPPGVRLLSLDREGTAAALWPLVRALRQHRPQWLLSAFPHTNIAAVLALALARRGGRCRTRVAVTEHAPLSLQIGQQANWRYRLLPRLVRWAYPRADAVVAVSEGVRADLQQIAGPALMQGKQGKQGRSLPPQVIANPVLPPGFEAEAAQPPDHPWLRDPQLQVVLSVCRLAVEKDLPTLLQAFAQLHRQRPATRLLLAGEGPERPRLQALVDALGLQAVVQLPGRTAQPLRWMRHATVFALPSRFEGFGNVLIEALACGTPVVSTDCPVGPRELLAGGRHGALVPVGDAPALARAIEAALDDPRPPPGAQAAALRYTREAACAAYLQLFDGACHAAGGGPAC